MGQRHRKTTQTSRKSRLKTFWILKSIIRSPWSYLWCAYIWGWNIRPRQIHRTNVKAYLSIILPPSAVMSEAPACYQSLCLWSCLKLARLLALSFPLCLMPQMASRLSHIVMLQCVNRRNYKRCADTLYTSICADGRKESRKRGLFWLFFFFQGVNEWMKKGWELDGNRRIGSDEKLRRKF